MNSFGLCCLTSTRKHGIQGADRVVFRNLRNLRSRKEKNIYILSTARRGRETVVNSRSDAWTTTRNIARAHACFCIALDHGRERNQHPWSVRMRHVGIRTYDLPGIFKNSRKDVVGKTARPPQHYNSGCLVMQLIATFSMLVGTFR